jgi:hypothetical protein
MDRLSRLCRVFVALALTLFVVRTIYHAGHRHADTVFEVLGFAMIGCFVAALTLYGIVRRHEEDARAARSPRHHAMRHNARLVKIAGGVVMAAGPGIMFLNPRSDDVLGIGFMVLFAGIAIVIAGGMLKLPFYLVPEDRE